MSTIDRNIVLTISWLFFGTVADIMFCYMINSNVIMVINMLNDPRSHDLLVIIDMLLNVLYIFCTTQKSNEGRNT